MDPKPSLEQAGKPEIKRNEKGQFPPGQSGNPTGEGGLGDHPENINFGGRPKNEVSVLYWIKKYLEDVEPGHNKTRAQELAEKIVTLAYKDGNVSLLKEILDRIEGKVPLRLDGNVGEGLQLVAQKLDEIINEEETEDENNKPVAEKGKSDSNTG